MSNIPMSVYIERQRQQRLKRTTNTVERRKQMRAYIAEHPMCTCADIANALGIGYETARHELPLLVDTVDVFYGRRGSDEPSRYKLKETASCAKG